MVFSDWHCDVAAIQSRTGIDCDIIFVNYSCTHKLAQRRSSLVSNHIHGFACKKGASTHPTILAELKHTCKHPNIQRKAHPFSYIWIKVFNFSDMIYSIKHVHTHKNQRKTNQLGLLFSRYRVEKEQISYHFCCTKYAAKNMQVNLTCWYQIKTWNVYAIKALNTIIFFQFRDTVQPIMTNTMLLNYHDYQNHYPSTSIHHLGYHMELSVIMVMLVITGQWLKWLPNHFTNRLWIYNLNIIKIHVALTWKIMIKSCHNFAHVTTAELSWHVQSCDLIGSLDS